MKHDISNLATYIWTSAIVALYKVVISGLALSTESCLSVRGVYVSVEERLG